MSEHEAMAEKLTAAGWQCTPPAKVEEYPKYLGTKKIGTKPDGSDILVDHIVNSAEEEAAAHEPPRHAKKEAGPNVEF